MAYGPIRRKEDVFYCVTAVLLVYVVCYCVTLNTIILSSDVYQETPGVSSDNRGPTM